MIRLALWNMIMAVAVLVCAGVISVNMYFSYKGAQYMHVVQESEASVYAMRDEIMRTVSSTAKESVDSMNVAVSHLVTVNEATISVSLP